MVTGVQNKETEFVHNQQESVQLWAQWIFPHHTVLQKESSRDLASSAHAGE